jgi:hypothetical protein
MANDSWDSMIRLGKATVAVQRGAEISRFEVHTASLRLVPGRRPIPPHSVVTHSLARLSVVASSAISRLVLTFDNGLLGPPGCPRRPDCPPWASSLYGNRLLSPSADNKWSSPQPRAEEHAACQSPMWSPGVRVESRRPKAAPWRPPESTRPRAKSFCLVEMPASD